MGNAGAQQAADQCVAGRGWDALDPGDDVPEHGPDQRAKHDCRGHRIGIDDTLADGFRHVQPDQPIGGKVADSGKDHGSNRRQQARGDHGRDRVGRIVQAVEKVESQRHDDEADKQGHGKLVHCRSPVRA
jgi:hypothetical protein